MVKPEPTEKARKRNTYNLLIAALAGQVGCLTLVIIIAAVLGGMSLDAHLGTKPWFTIGLLVVSIPISLVLMFFIARKTVSKIKTSKSEGVIEEEVIGKDS
jgi:F0F1-type ATP synthase assembly protein I